MLEAVSFLAPTRNSLSLPPIQNRILWMRLRAGRDSTSQFSSRGDVPDKLDLGQNNGLISDGRAGWVPLSLIRHRAIQTALLVSRKKSEVAALLGQSFGGIPSLIS